MDAAAVRIPGLLHTLNETCNIHMGTLLHVQVILAFVKLTCKIHSLCCFILVSSENSVSDDR